MRNNFDVPIIVIGGGGYNIESVAKCWTYETSLCIGQKIDNTMPEN